MSSLPRGGSRESGPGWAGLPRRSNAADWTRREGERDDRGLPARAYAGLVVLALCFAALCGAALSWDGSGYLFETLDKQVPFTTHLRLISVPLQLPVLLASRITDNPTILQTFFGLPYVAIPLLALSASWWIVRDRAPWLFVWPVLGIGLGTLAGQFNFTSEAIIALQLFWPVLLALLAGMRRGHVPLVLVLCLAILCSHPYAVPLFAAASVVALVRAKSAGRGGRLRWWAAGFATAAVLGVVALRTSSYDTQQLSSGGLLWSFAVSTPGLPLVAIGSALLTGLTVLAVPFARRRNGRLIPILHSLGLLGIVGVGLSLALWVRDPHLWRWANKLSYPALIATLCFMAMAVLEGSIHTPEPPYGAGGPARDALDWEHRVRTIRVVAIVFSLVLCIQSAVWFNLVGRLGETLDQRTWSCLSMSPIAWIQGTPLDQFDTPAQSLLLQGRVPQAVLLSGNGCGDTTFSGGVPLTQYAVRNWQGGWFDLRPLRQQLLAEQDSARGCSFTLTSGWYTTETDGPHWWRWSDGRDARIRILVNGAGPLVLSGQFQSIDPPDRVDVLLNGRLRMTIAITWSGLQPIVPLTLPLRQGENMIQLKARNPARAVVDRQLAIGVANLAAVAGYTPQRCDLHP